jgi:hypothetical protein
MQKYHDLKAKEHLLDSRSPGDKTYAHALVPKIKQYRIPEREYESAKLEKDAAEWKH